MKVLDYQIIKIASVVMFTNNGWRVYGSPLLNADGELVQAVILYEDENADIWCRS